MVRVVFFGIAILAGCATEPDTGVSQSGEMKTGAVLPDTVGNQNWASRGIHEEKLQAQFHANVVKVQQAHLDGVMTGIAIDPYHVVLKCSSDQRGYRVTSGVQGKVTSARLLAKGPDELCVLRTISEIAGVFRLGLSDEVQIGAKVYARAASPEGVVWISTTIEEVVQARGGRRLGIATGKPEIDGQPLFDERGYLAGIVSGKTLAGGATATALDWLVPILVQPRPCLADTSVQDESPGDPERLDAISRESFKANKQSIEAETQRFALSVRDRVIQRRNPFWYPPGAQQLGLEGMRKAVLAFRDGKLQSIEIEGSEGDLLRKGVEQLLACIDLPPLPQSLRVGEFAFTQAFSFRLDPAPNAVGTDPK